MASAKWRTGPHGTAHGVDRQLDVIGKAAGWGSGGRGLSIQQQATLVEAYGRTALLARRACPGFATSVYGV